MVKSGYLAIKWNLQKGLLTQSRQQRCTKKLGMEVKSIVRNWTTTSFVYYTLICYLWLVIFFLHLFLFFFSPPSLCLLSSFTPSRSSRYSTFSPPLPMSLGMEFFPTLTTALFADTISTSALGS